MEDANLKRYISWAKHGTTEPKGSKGRPKGALNLAALGCGSATKQPARKGVTKRLRGDAAVAAGAGLCEQRVTRARVAKGCAGVVSEAGKPAMAAADGKGSSKADARRATRGAVQAQAGQTTQPKCRAG